MKRQEHHWLEVVNEPACSKVRQLLIVVLVSPFVCTGPSFSDALLTCVEGCKEAALGVFVKLLELTARESAEHRGTIPADTKALSRATGFPADVIKTALDVLSGAGWIAVDNTAPESPGISGRFLNGRDLKEDEDPAKSFAGAPSPLPAGKDPTPKGQGDDQDPPTGGESNPLAKYPELNAFYPQLLTLIREAHPKTRVVVAGSKSDHEGRETLSKLARLDRFSEADIIGALEWVLTSEHADAQFWRRQVAAVRPLRHTCKSGLTKFAAIHERWKESAGREAPDIEGAESWTPERIAKFERELAIEQQRARATV